MRCTTSSFVALLAVLGASSCDLLDRPDPVAGRAVDELIASSGEAAPPAVPLPGVVPGVAAPPSAANAPGALSAPGVQPAPGAPPAGPVVDLLRVTDMQVVVSSTASPASQGPSALVDGDDATAWAADDGDMTGAWIALVVPEGAAVRELAIGLAAPDATSGRGAGSTSVAAVTVERDGQVVTEVPLDPSRGGWQPIAVDGPGGVWVVRVSRVVHTGRGPTRGVRVTGIGVRGVAPAEPAPCAASPNGCRPRTLVGAVAGGGEPHVPSRGARPVNDRAWEPSGSLRIERLAPEDRPFQRLVQAEWRTLVRPVRLVELAADQEERVAIVLYAVDEAAHAAEGGAAPAAAGCRDGVEVPCASLYLARASIPTSGVPVLDGAHRVATDLCTVASGVEVRDIDGDRRPEAIVTVEQRTHRGCDGRDALLRTEVVVDLERLREQYRGPLLVAPTGDCGERREAVRSAEDVNFDGHRDFIVETTVDVIRCDGRARERLRQRERAVFLYDAGRDEWRSQP